ncbi:MAG: GNAT family N-acetyltransferase, partial [Bacteroidota bacterium]
HRVTAPDTLQKIYTLRSQVFVEEQGVSPEEEFDIFEELSIHWAATHGDEVIACARHRQTEPGSKIDRMAVHTDFRRQGVGRDLLLRIMEDLLSGISALKNGAAGVTAHEIYLHAQVQALPFYLRLGFAQVGELFYEADIPHYRCVYLDALNV